MNLEIILSPRTVEWLERRAHAAGTDEAAFAATVLDQIAEQELGTNGVSAQVRLAAFDQWLASLPLRPGPPVHTDRASIYD